MAEIRNFCIIAHIDHGKSTLADRFLEMTNSVKSAWWSQMLDTMDLEQERGITIKLTPARMSWKGVELNLIDTPGHVDFQYEVSRSLAAVEGAILLVDASQGIQAQTLSTLYMALDNNLPIIPVLNKIDLPAADVDRVTKELEQVIGIDPDEVIAISAKTGENVDRVLDAVIERVDPPHRFKQDNMQKFWTERELASPGEVSRALIFDSVFDQYKGVVAYVKMVDGSMQAWDSLQLVHSHTTIQPTEVWFFVPAYVQDKLVQEWQIGYIVTGQKSVRDARIGDTIIRLAHKHKKPTPDQLKPYVIPGFQKMKPFVFAGVYPVESDQYEKLKEAFGKLSLNDSAIAREYEQSNAMGHGFRCGFLGTLHMDIIKERLSREWWSDTIFTTPTVTYLVKVKYLQDERIVSGMNIKELIKTGLYRYLIDDAPTDLPDDQLAELLGEELTPRLIVKSGGDMPDQWMIEEIWEPIVEVEIVGPEEYSGNIMTLAQEYRGELKAMEYLDELRVLWKYRMPMGEIVVDFYDRLKSVTKGYATMNYEFVNYQLGDLVRLDIYINEERVEAFSLIVHEENSYYTGREIVQKLKELIPRHLFKVPLQAGIGSKIIARETIPAIRKDVIAKCYGGDVSRKRKLLQRQKEGKKKMKQMGKVSVPNDVFIKMVSR